MNKIISCAFAVATLLAFGCGKSSPASTQVTNWGVVEVAASSPKHLKLAGNNCTLTATPLANGNLAVLIESDTRTDKNGPPGVPSGTLVHTRQNMILPANVECACSIDARPVRFTLKLKRS